MGLTKSHSTINISAQVINIELFVSWTYLSVWTLYFPNIWRYKIQSWKTTKL